MQLPSESFNRSARNKLDAALYSPRKGHNGALDRMRTNKSFMTMGYLLIWYLFSTASTFTNKVLIKQHHLSAEKLTLSHLFVSVVCDFIVLTFPSGTRTNAWRLQSMSFRGILWILPLSLFSVMTKVLTYWSYDAVPVAIAHTCKASQPLFNVILAYLIYHSKFSLATYLSLVPIVCGVVLASVSEMGLNDLALGGVIFAVSSALLGVVQSMYAKFLLRSHMVVDSINLHFYSAFLSFAINAPLVIFGGSGSSSPDKLPQSLMHFTGSICASLVLSEVSELTYSIMCTMKRVVIILSAVFYFGNAVTAQSMVGMALAVAGVGSYQLIKVRTKMYQDAGLVPLPRTVNDVNKAMDRRK